MKNRLRFALKALRQLGLEQTGLYALYQLGLRSGYYRWVERRGKRGESGEQRVGREQRRESREQRGERRKEQRTERRREGTLFKFPRREEVLAVLGSAGQDALLAEADEIVRGKVRLFGAEPVDLVLTPPGPLAHWTAYETGKAPLPHPISPSQSFPADIKFIWEPARFGWAFPLGRAFYLTGDEIYAKTFWQNFETFSAANPPFLGPNWASAQEVALRLIAFVWAGEIFAPAAASTPERLASLAASIATHAARIPPTLAYARAQNNNHLLSEAAGLLTAGLALRDHPDASRWRALGWKWLNHGLQAQIDSSGEYAQHSTNYHRLMLQLVLWTNALVEAFDLRWPRPTLEAIQRAVHWLLSLVDFESGHVPNLGANDGAYIFPLSICPFSDFRPVAHAAARVFLDYHLPPGPWDEMALWLGAPARGPHTLDLPRYVGDQLYGPRSWGYFRTAQFSSRPSHADQLHLDLWWRGLNVAQDAGTYLYNAAPPWDNALTTAFVHNTVTVNGRDQMTRAGRFLYLDWVNAYRKALPVQEPGELQRVRGRYWGKDYRHTRTISVFEGDRWRIVDEILPLSWHPQTLTARLHWLLPDWEWRVERREKREEIRLASPHGIITMTIHHSQAATSSFSLFRAGQPLLGTLPPDPTRGWTSPTYRVKIPALSLALVVESDQAITFATEFTFP